MNWDFLADFIEPNALLLDCRSEDAFSAGTLAGAFGVAAIKKPFGSGPKSMAQLSGIINEILARANGKSSIISFDEGQGMYASRMTWLLHTIGYTKAKMLSAKISEMKPEQLEPGQEQIPVHAADKPRTFRGIFSIAELQQNLTRVQLLDVRTPNEYEGLLPRLTNPEPDSICGRIPGSINWDWRLLYGPDGHLKEKMGLLMEIKKRGLIQERPTVIYDYNGARSCTTALILRNSGYKQIHVYLGSWMEWRKSNLPKQNVRAWEPG